MPPVTNEEFQQLSPLQKLLKSRKFLIVVVDLVVSSVTYIIANTASPETFEHWKFFMVTTQPVILLLIGSIAYEDGQEKRSDTYIPREPEAVG